MRIPVALGALIAATLGATFGATSARAHLKLTKPTARYEQSAIGDPQKAGPCGVGGASDVRGKNVTVYRPGQEITVEWTETIAHPGHFRILFDPNGQSFPDPTSYTDFDAGGDKTLADNIPRLPSGSSYRQTVRLPDVECDRCTLQVLQVMTDKPPFGPGGGNDFYYHCADITLARPAGDGGVGGDSGVSSDSGVSGDSDIGPVSDAAIADDGTTSPAAEGSDAGGCRTTRGPAPVASMSALIAIAAGLLGLLARLRRRAVGLPRPR